MPSPKLLIFLAFWLSFSSALKNETKSPEDTYSDGSSAACNNCNICPSLCQSQVPPPPPPPPPAQVNCPPPPPEQGNQVVCCQNAPPVVPYFFNPNNPNNNPAGNNQAGNNPAGNNQAGNNQGGNNQAGNSPPMIQINSEHKIKPTAATWLSAFFIFISIMVRT